MEKIAIVVDSDSGLNLETSKKLGVTLLCKPLNCDGKEIIDTVTFSYDEFLEEFRKGKIYKTSQVPTFIVEETFKELLETHDYILYFPISSKLSTAYENGLNIASNYNGRIHVFDHKTIAEFQKHEVEVALKLINQGLSYQEICKIMDARCGRAYAYIIPENLDYIKKSGRVSPAIAALSNLIGFTPLLVFKDGGVEKEQIARTRRQALKLAIKKLSLTGFTPDTHKLIILTTKEKEKEDELINLCKEDPLLSKFSPVTSYVPGVILCHSGPGVVAIGFTEL